MAQLTITPAFSTSASSSASTSYPRYDVFLNHRGPDCKHTFAIRLYRRLCDEGLLVFLDSEELIEGNNITPQLEAAIKGASVQVAIFSPTYAKSEWCLKELVLMVNSGATILPVFYDVEPSMVRRATGTYGEALQNLQQKRTRDPQTGELKPRYDSNTVQSWRDALLHVGDISGFVLHGDEFELLEKVVQSVRKNVPKTPLDVATYPTGLDEKLRDLERMVEPESQELKPVGAKIVGIVGVGGVGKTTLAKHFFNLKRSRYDASSFLFDVREKARSGSLNYLQSQLIHELKNTDIKIESSDQGIGELKKHLSSCKRVLIILDDIDHIDQMEKLLPMKDSLSQESLILVTSRDRHVLRVEEKSIYYLKGLHRPDSKVLFCSHAFFQRYPPEGFADLVDRFVTACDGLALSLKVFGAAVCGRKQSYWEEMLERLRKRLPTEIQERLGISYESLEKEDQEIFLDIVCFFLGEEIDTAIRIWGTVGLENLESKCLLEVDRKNKIKMHDHIRDMGRIIAKKVSLPRRLSQIDDFLEQTSSGMTEVRGISMVPRVPDSLLFTSPSHLKNPKWELFHKYSYDCMNLKILATEGGYLEAILRRVPSAPLLWLRWYHCPYSSLPSWVPMENLRVLEVAGSRLETLWQLESQAPIQLRELNIFSPLSHFPKSIGQLNHLEKIFVGHESCILQLKSLTEEFCNLHSLKYLTLHRCSNMVSLPDSFGKLTSLQGINLNRAFSLMTLPSSFGNLTNLQHFELSGASSWETLPNFLGNLTNLQRFTLLDASRLETLPYSFGNLTNLQHFELSGASRLETLPNSFGNLTNLQHFKLSGASIWVTLPNSLGNLTNLQHFELSGASKLETLPNSFGNLTNLWDISLSGASKLETLPNSFGNLTNLWNISLSGASKLETLPNSFGNLTNLRNISLSDAASLETLPNSFGNLTNLRNISLSGASKLETLPNSFENLTNLRNISLSDAASLETLPLPILFENLINEDIKFSVSGASSLETLPLPKFFGDLERVQVAVDFQNVNVKGTSSLETLPNSFGNLTNLRNISLSDAASLETLSLPIFFGNLSNVSINLSLSGASSLERLPLPIFFGNLTRVYIHVDFQNVNINLSGASSLATLPLPIFFGNLREVYIDFSLSGASSLERLPLPNFFGNLTSVYLHIDIQSVNINLSGASSLATLPLPNFFGDLERVQVAVDFQNVHINLSSASSLETHPLPNFFGNLENVSIHLSLSGTSSLERLPLPNFFGDLRAVSMHVEFQNVNNSLSGASSLETVPLPIFFGNLRDVSIHLSLSGASSLGRLPLPNFFGDLENVNMYVDFQNVNINLSGASSLETLPLLNFFGKLRSVNIRLSLSGVMSGARLPLPNFFEDLESVHRAVDFQNVNIDFHF